MPTRAVAIYVAHPKGERAWGKERLAPILPAARQAMLDYLDERRTYLRGQVHEALIPLRRLDGTLTYWSDGLFAKLKGRLERESGVQFHLRTFRSTFAQVAKDHNVSIEAVSRGLGHRTTRTTEIYYGRIRTESALAEFEQAFAVSEVRFSN
ncbi:MAG TPA: site-specific integrase [Thermoplasmata archaeon]